MMSANVLLVLAAFGALSEQQQQQKHLAGPSMKEKSYNNDSFTPMDYEILEQMPMYMYDDNENLVKLTLDDDVETLDKTKIIIENLVFFFLYTKNNPTEPQQLYVNDKLSLQNSNFDFTKPTRFITHGWMTSRKSPACVLIRQAYMKKEDCNVIVVDWSKISYGFYIEASRRVPVIGKFVSTMIDFLEKEGMDLSKTILIGHSLGAHVAGLAARNAQGNVSFVAGLDPALPGFHSAGPGSRISSGDAQYVEIIHTNGGHLGFMKAIGDSDFYPNGGKKQSGCLTNIIDVCSHSRSYKYFAESINSFLGFHARKCSSFDQFKSGLCKNNTALMGYKLQLYAHGTYFLLTNSKSLFARGELGASPE